MKKKINKLRKKFNIQIKNKDFLINSLTHKSFNKD